MNIPAPQVTLSFLQEKLENAFFNIVKEDEDSLTIYTNTNTNVTVSLSRSDCIKFQTLYELQENTPTRFNKALEQSNELNKQIMGIQSHVEQYSDGIVTCFCFYMFFGDIFDLKLFVSNLNIMSRLSTPIFEENFL